MADNYWDRVKTTKNAPIDYSLSLDREKSYGQKSGQLQPPSTIQGPGQLQPPAKTGYGQLAPPTYQAPQAYQAPKTTQIGIGDTQKIMDESLKRTSELAAGKSDYMEGLKKRYLGMQAAAGTAQAGALEQELAGAGMSESEKQTHRYMQERKADREQIGLMGDLFEQESLMTQGAQSEAFNMAYQAKQLKANEMRERIDTLMAGGGADNLHQAGKLMEELMGVPVDLHMARQENVMQVLGGLASVPGMSIDEVISQADKSGDLKYLGLTKEEARRYIEPIMHANNPIYQAKAQYGDLLESGEIDEKTYDKMVKLITWQQTNPEGVEVFDSWIVKDRQGNEVGNFKTEEEADSFVAQKGGAKEFTANGYIDYEGKYDEYLPVGEGGLFEDKSGALYMVKDGQKMSATPDWDDPFSIRNEDLVEYYEMNPSKEGEKLSEKILETQFRQIINNPMDIPENIPTSSPLYQKLLGSGKVSNLKEFDSLAQTEKGSGKSSRVRIEALEGLAMDSLVNVGGRVYVYRGDTPHAVTGDDDYTEYELYDVSYG